MALQLGALYKALVNAGADDDTARAAAEEVAAYDRQLAEIRGDLTLLKWMVATLITLQIALGVGNLWLTMNVLARLPR